MTIPVEDEPYSPFPFPAEVDGVDPSALKAFLAFRKLFDTFQYLVQKDLSQGGTQPAQMAVLRLLAMNDGLCQREIADAMRLSRPRVTSILQTMEKAGSVRRARDDADQRLARVFITDLGRSLDQEKSYIREEHINSIFGDMSEQDRSELVRRFDDLTLRLQRRLQRNGAA
ncbi:MAG: hypothetical protein A2133_05985 [Actinobacteria bacterium RBG_16_64_13]|nr:MAG: hypothetical protein A2133_05985 [Actinobacteria bacterium RBG_16_64_13]